MYSLFFLLYFAIFFLSSLVLIYILSAALLLSPLILITSLLFSSLLFSSLLFSSLLFSSNLFLHSSLPLLPVLLTSAFLFISYPILPLHIVANTLAHFILSLLLFPPSLTHCTTLSLLSQSSKEATLAVRPISDPRANWQRIISFLAKN